MNGFIISLGMGLVVGVAYGLCGIRSPAPPLVALAGLLGMVLGEQAVGMARTHFVQNQHQAAGESEPDVGVDKKSDRQ